MTSLSSYRLFFLMIFISFAIHPVALRRFAKSYLEKPKIRLKAFMDDEEYEVQLASSKIADVDANQFDSEYVIRNGSDYIILEAAREVIFACEASYPIKWKPNPENFAGMTRHQDDHIRIVTKTVSDFTETMAEPQVKRYYAYISLKTHYSISGYISCQAVDDDPKGIRSIYIWNESEEDPINLNNLSWESMDVMADPHLPNFIIPCRPKSPQVMLSLEKKSKVHKFHENDTEAWHTLELNHFITFDPKIGFTIDKSGLRTVPGNYRCSVKEEREDDNEPFYAYVDVTVGDIPSIEFTPKIRVKRPAILNTTNLELQCSAGSNWPDSNETVHADYTRCTSGAECEFMKEVFLRDNLIKNPEYKDTYDIYTTTVGTYKHAVLFYCKGANIDVVAEYVVVYNSKEIIPYSYEENATNAMAIYDANKEIPTEYKIHFAFQRLNEVISPVFGPELLYYYEQAVPMMYGYQGRSQTIGAMLFQEQLNDNSQVEELRRRIYFSQFPTGYKMFEGMELVVICIADQFFYSEGGWLAINWRNGSKTIFKEGTVEFEKTNFSLVRFMSETNHVVMGRINSMEIEMDSIDCILPVWNARKWDKRTFSLAVNESFVPELHNPEEEILNLKLDEYKITLNCSIVPSEQEKSLPVTIKWEKDGRELEAYVENGIVENYDVSSYETSNLTYSVLVLRNITFDIHGEYQCIATNLKGSAVKTFKVFVIDEEGIQKRKNLVIITVLCLVIVVGLCGVVLFLSRKLWLSRIRISHFSR